ncbi:hypothetical protein SLEP1_g52693 [Rubroshorea leprosula]|uniref:Uncharacterized protein n=1 Tax=Rubroshorea leprosula TaxID=152421 RepID=A0AAV5M780_9ROSI|nr:hypothetical protein SLEP1_g52693 [Rubroshorea leprosula]
MKEEMVEAQKRSLMRIEDCESHFSNDLATWVKNAIRSHSPHQPRCETPLSRTTGHEWRVEERRSKNEESD